MGECAGKQQGNPGQEYLGYNAETEAVSGAAAALSGDANLLCRTGSAEHKRTEDFVWETVSAVKERKSMIREQQADFKASST